MEIAYLLKGQFSEVKYLKAVPFEANLLNHHTDSAEPGCSAVNENKTIEFHPDLSSITLLLIQEPTVSSTPILNP